jgi:hypothetical protein
MFKHQEKYCEFSQNPKQIISMESQRATIPPLIQNDEESSAKIASPAPPLLSVDKLAWQILPDKFSARTTRFISRHIADLYCDSLRPQVYKISEIPTNELQISVTDAGLSSIFGRKESWSRGMICE